jgi:hypothetical protein
MSPQLICRINPKISFYRPNLKGRPCLSWRETWLEENQLPMFGQIGLFLIFKFLGL